MEEINFYLIFNFFTFLFIPFVFGVLAKKFNIPPLVGYIIGGLVYGNLFLNFSYHEAIKNFAYFGILFLLFTVGLETNFKKLFYFKKIILIAGFLQIILSVIFIFLLSLFFKFSFLTSFLIGLALSSSSTTIIAKIIQDRGEESSFLGEITMGMLLFQDIAFIPFMIIFSSIVGKQNLTFFDFFSKIFFSLLKSGLIILGLFYFGEKIVPYFFNKVAKLSRELFNLFIIIFIFFITTFSLFLNIPTLISVFIAGILLSSTIEHHHIFSQIRPIRDILAVVFFVYIGTNVKVFSLINSFFYIILFTFFVVLIKFLIVFFIFLFLRFHTKISFNLALHLFQIDEDAFILMSIALANNLISNQEYFFILSVVLITLIATPILIRKKDIFYQSIRDFIKKRFNFLDNFINFKIDSDKSPIDILDIKNHVVICGYGRVGSYIGQSLMIAGIPYIAIDYNLHLVEKAKKEGVNIIYGDPTDIDILDYAQVDEASILVLALPDISSQESIIMNARKLNKDIFIISRVHKKIDKLRVKDLGVDLVIQPEFEASISIIRKIYLMKKFDKEEIIRKIKRFRIESGMS